MKKVRVFVPVSLAVFISVIPVAFLGLVWGVPTIQEWQVKQSIVVAEGSEQLFDNKRPQSGGYSQRNIYHWSSQAVDSLRAYYQEFTTPFVEVSSYDKHWLIATWNTSKVIEPTNRGIYIHTDLCDYRDTFNCLSVTIIDNSQSDLEATLQGMFGLEPDKLSLIPNGGTLVIFTYTIPS